MTNAIEREVRRIAEERCEYCHLPQSAIKLTFTVDHIRAKQHGGGDEPGNLALACPFCNRHKGPNIAGIDPVSGQLTPLFHPRVDRWTQHFRWEGAAIVGLTPVGRATVAVLAVNDRFQLSIRRAIMGEGAFPLP